RRGCGRGSGDGGNHVVDGGEDPLASGERRIEMQGDELLFAVGLDRDDALDLPATGNDVLGAALTDELQNIDGDLIVRARDERHWWEVARHSLRDRSAAGAEKNRAGEQQAKARTHRHIVRPGLASPRAR